MNDKLIRYTSRYIYIYIYNIYLLKSHIYIYIEYNTNGPIKKS